MSLEELEQLCSELREYIVSCCAANPGHIGASLGVVEIAVALHRVFDTPNDKIVWDVGHQAYAHKILTGRREAFKTNRKLGGISGFPKRSRASMTHSAQDTPPHPFQQRLIGCGCRCREAKIILWRL